VWRVTTTVVLKFKDFSRSQVVSHLHSKHGTISEAVQHSPPTGSDIWVIKQQQFQ